MSEEWLLALRRAVDQSSIQKVALFIGVSPAAISTALRGKYPASTKKLEQKVLAKIGELAPIECPAIEKTITVKDCAFMRMRACPPSMPDALRQWSACESCPVGARLMLPHREDKKKAPHAQR